MSRALPQHIARPTSRHVVAWPAAVALWGAASASHALEWPSVPAPPRSSVEWVARDAVVNGLPTRVERFETELTPAEVLTHYRGLWAKAAAGSPRETQSGPWRGLSTLSDGFQLAVQVRPRQPSGSEGLISIAHFKGMQREVLPAQISSFPDTRVTQVTESTDGPQRSQLVTLVSTQSFELNVQRWRGEWTRRGYQMVFEQQPPAASDGVRTWLASFSKPPHSVDMALAWRPSDRRSFLTANLLGPAPGVRP
jgi:hypothetical protein